MGDVESGKIWNAVIINLRFLLRKCKVSVSACNLRKTKENINENRPLLRFWLVASIEHDRQRTKHINELAFVPR